MTDATAPKAELDAAAIRQEVEAVKASLAAAQAARPETRAAETRSEQTAADATLERLADQAISVLPERMRTHVAAELHGHARYERAQELTALYAEVQATARAEVQAQFAAQAEAAKTAKAAAELGSAGSAAATPAAAIRTARSTEELARLPSGDLDRLLSRQMSARTNGAAAR